MLASDIWVPFVEWLNEAPDGKRIPWVELGLKSDAPESAKKAYAEFLETERWAAEEGILT